MKLVRFGVQGREAAGLVDAQGDIRSLASIIDTIDGPLLADESAMEKLKAMEPESLPKVAAGTRLGAPVANVGKIVCIGLNYRLHALESGLPEPEEPVFFMKATSAICGPNDPIQRPVGSKKLDWEVELAFVIGRATTGIVPIENAGTHIAGYMLMNDVSEREFQLERGPQWTKGKSHDTFAPLGPWLVTADEISNPEALELRCSVNGNLMQQGNTDDLIFGLDRIIHTLSMYMSLQPGDVVATGTPSGVGSGRKPPVFLQSGDLVTLSCDELGRQSASVI